ncbi:hypothetical protein [Streptomyces sp. NPDC058371]|uniref:hypothetical protein n=1 Tax=Streptomyces sp. NPDC058371 TaxID=3346463 RepID=UPI00365BC259
MTTPTPLQTQPTPPIPELSADAPAGMTVDALERKGRLANLQRGLRLARTLDHADAPPEAGPRDLTGIYDAMATAQNEQAYYFSHPNWHALRDIRQQVESVLQRLNEQAEITPQAAIQAAKITTLAASLIARHAAKISAHLDTWDQRNTPGGRAMRGLTRVAENHAARASGLDSAQALETPRLLIAHVHNLTKELRRAETPREGTPDPGVDDPNDPELDSALSAGAAVDPELAEASQLMNALTELGGQARRAGHRLTLDVRLHGLVETAQLRGFEMVSGIAQSAMRRYDNQDRATDGRRNIAAMIFHYAEQRLERMRGTLGADEQHDFGHYETDPPDRYMDALYEESRAVARALRNKSITPEERTDLQIRFLLAQTEISVEADNGQEWGTQAVFPPSDLVGGMQTDDPVENRLTLVKALRRRVDNNPFDRNAHFLNKVADRLAQEIAGPPELTAQALEADLHAGQVRAVAAHLVEQGTVASPLVLSEIAELNLTHGQAERALAVLQTVNVVGPPNGLEPRETLTVSSRQLPRQLALLEQHLPTLLKMQKGAAANSASTVPATPDPPAQPQSVPAAEPLAAAEPEPAPAAPTEPPPPSAAPELPQRDRSAERRHPGNIRRQPAPAAETPTDPYLAQLLEGHEARLKEVSQSVIAGREDRAAAHSAPAVVTATKPTHPDEAQHNAQHAQQTADVGVR